MTSDDIEQARLLPTVFPITPRHGDSHDLWRYDNANHIPTVVAPASWCNAKSLSDDPKVVGFGKWSLRSKGPVRTQMRDREFDASLHVWWYNLKLHEQENVMRRPASDPMPEWLVRTLHEAGVPGVIETPVDPEIVGPWFALPTTVDEFLAFQREQRMSRSA